MGLTKQKLGLYIERVERRNKDLQYGFDDVRGVSNTKEIQLTKADISDRSFNRFQIVEPKEFVFNRRTTRMGEKLGLGYNNIDEVFIVTEDYVVFRVTDKTVLLPDYLNIFFRRPEFDRYARWDSWGSATEFFNWEEMCDVPIIVPPLPIQQKYVNVYNAMLANQRAYESGLEDLKLTCLATIEDLRRHVPCEEIGSYIEAKKEKNTDLEITYEQGINIDKQFITPQRSNADLTSRVKVRTGQFAYCTQLNNENVAIAYRTGCDCVVSPVYNVFEVSKPDKLLPEYLMMWLIRPEFGRFVYWASAGSAYEFLQFENLCEVNIPIPDMSLQKSIADIYIAYTTRSEINEKLKTQIKDLCPILIKGSLEEAERA